MQNSFVSWLTVASILMAALPATSSEPSTTAYVPNQSSRSLSLDSTLRLLRQMRCVPESEPESHCRGRVLLRFRTPQAWTAGNLAERLKALNVEIDPDASIGRVVEATIPLRRLSELVRIPQLTGIESLWSPGLTSPLDETVARTGVVPARRDPDMSATGSDVTVGLIDSGIDVFHPAFFRADGGFYRWIDANDDGDFDPGIDGVDLNRNGQFEPRRERVRLLDSATVRNPVDGEVEGRDESFEPTEDWLFADTNLNQRRDVGRSNGFLETTPAYGEPIFVADDVNENGRLDPLEKLVRLDTSKIESYTKNGTTYRRGKDLIRAGSDRGNEVRHGTGSAGILVGGQLGYHERVGMVPEADVAVVGRSDQRLGMQNELPFGGMARLNEFGVDVLLHEWTSPFIQPIDGSTSFEMAMSESRDDGLFHVVPAGNLGSSDKHWTQKLASGEDVSLTFKVDEGLRRNGKIFPFREVFGSIQGTEDVELALNFEAPNGNSVSLGDEPIDEVVGESRLVAVSEVTSSGNHHTEFFIEPADSTDSLETGTWTVSIQNRNASGRVVARVSDDRSDWEGGVHWRRGSDSSSSIAFPASARAGFVSAAYRGKRGPPDLRDFSGEGPTMDGRPAVDIAAPDNPDVPLGFESSFVERGWEPGWFLTFGGTSGAAAHVAGGAAAIRGVSPGLTADSLEESLHEAASSQDLTPAPDSLPCTAWGYGRLDVGGVLGVSNDTPNNRPTFEVHERGFDPVVVEVDTSDPDGNDVSVRFDVGYDGTWDTEWGETRKIDISMSGSTERILRVAVRDSRGGLRERLVEVSSSARVDTADVEPTGDVGEPKMRSTEACCQTTGGAVLFEIWLVLFGLFGQLGLGWRRS